MPKQGQEEMIQMIELDEVRKAILTALVTMEKPAGCGEIAKKANLSTPEVVGKMRGLLEDGLMERPVKGKYVISDVGREALGKLPGDAMSRDGGISIYE
jgi:predicted transcriptional regulator